jgi:dihydroorotate dehydrogenase electron transfer subunit
MIASNTQPSTVSGEVIENLSVASDHFLLTLRLPPSFGSPKPGQFVMVRDPKRREPLLSRPLSVYGFRREEGGSTLELLCRVAGRGTTLLSQLKPGATLSILGPLGRGFTIDREARNVILLAGGVGVAPLTFLLREGYPASPSSRKADVTAYVGARTAALLTGLDRLKGFCDLRAATDDGSEGYHGLVTDLLRCELGGYPPKETMIYACGPTAMIRTLREIVMEFPFHCEVSLEERMACGIGACLGCAVAIADMSGKIDYQRVCQEGPVFDIRQLASDYCKEHRDKEHRNKDHQDRNHGIE